MDEILKSLAKQKFNGQRRKAGKNHNYHVPVICLRYTLFNVASGVFKRLDDTFQRSLPQPQLLT